MPDPKKILIIRTDRIGDAVLSIPVIENLRTAYPHAYIAFMCSPLTEDIVRTNPFLDEVIVYDKRGTHKSILSLLRFVTGLRRKKFDWAVILHSTNRVNWIAALSGIPLRIGWDRKAGFLLTRRIPYLKRLGEMHERDYNLELIKNLGVKIVSRQTRLYPDQKAAERIEHLFSKHGLARGGDLLIGIHPLSSCPSKMWPQRRYQELASVLVAEYKAKIIVIGGERIEFAVNGAAQQNIINVSGSLCISESIALIARLCVLISNDSGPVHIAGGVGIPCVVLFGRKQPGLSPRRWGPLGAEDKVIIKDAGCTECRAHNCTKEFLCIRSITVEEVLQQIRPFLRA